MKRKKATLQDLNALNIGFFAFQRIKNNDGVFGWRYTLEKSLTDEQRYYLNQFKNVQYSSCSYRYASEIKHDVVMLFDRCIV